MQRSLLAVVTTTASLFVLLSCNDDSRHPDSVAMGPAQRELILVLRASADSVAGLDPNDTLPEVPASNVPQAVVENARRLGQTAQRADPKCSRFFTNGKVFVALMELGCDPGTIYLHPEMYAVFKPNGERVARVLLWPESEEKFSVFEKDR